MQNYLLILLALTSNVFANPIETSSNVIRAEESTSYLSKADILQRNEATSFSSMEFTGPITTGGPDVKLYGTAKSIYEQILVLNPAYDVLDFPESAASLAAEGITRENIDQGRTTDISTTAALEARSLLKRQDGMNCSIRVYTFWFNCFEGLDYLRRLGSANCGARPNTCSRVSCSHDCVMYLCSKGDQINVQCQHIANDIQLIRNKCFRKSQIGLIFAGGRRAFNHHNIELGNDNC